MIQAFKGFFQAFQFIRRHRMAWLFLVPALLWIVLAVLFFMALEGPVQDLTAWLAKWLDIDEQKVEPGLWQDVLAVLDGARDVIVLVVLKVAIAYLMFTFNKYMVLVLMSPILAYASERTEEIITGRSHPFSWHQLMKDALRGSLIALRNGLLELLISAAIWLLTFLLPFGIPFSMVLLFLVSAYFYGFSMYDYIFERRRLGVRASTAEVNRRSHMVVANGALFSLMMKIPLLGMMLAPPMAAVGAVLSLQKDPIMAQQYPVPPRA